MTFSKRLPPVHEVNRVTRALGARTRPTIDLTATNPTTVGLRSGGADLFSDGPGDAALLAPLADPRGLVYAPDPKGLASARLAVSNWYAALHGVLAPPERVVLTASSSDAYGWLFKLLADPGDAVLLPAPSYPLLDALAGLESVALARYPLAAEDGFRVHAGDHGSDGLGVDAQEEVDQVILTIGKIHSVTGDRAEGNLDFSHSGTS